MNAESIATPWLAHRRLPWALAILGVLLCSPSLDLGFLLDDHYHRVMLAGYGDGPVGEPRAATDLFAFGSAAESPPSAVPWWAPEELRFRFFRPLASLSRAVDHRLFDSPWPMHAHSLLWLALVIAAAATLYRSLVRDEADQRLFSGPTTSRPAPAGPTTASPTTASPTTARPAAAGMVTAGLAAYFFAVDDAHAAPAMWLANRSALMALFFGLLGLLAHHRRRRHGWRPGAWLAPAALALAVLSAESGVATGAYLLAYALCLDRGPLSRRLLALAPCVTVGLVWATIYVAGDYGTAGSGLYVDPAGEPLRFAAAFVTRLPVLLWGQVGFPPTEALLVLSRPATALFTVVAVGLLAGLAVALRPTLRRDPVARFAALGLALSLLPIAATLPSNRLLGFVSIGGSYLLAALVSQAWLAYPPARSQRSMALAALLLLVHGALSPLLLVGAADRFRRVDRYFTAAAETLPGDPSASVVLAGAPTFYLAALAPVVRAARGEALPRELLTLATGAHGVRYERLGERTLRVRPAGGYLPPPGSGLPGSSAPWVDVRYFFQVADRLYGDGTGFAPGQTIHRGGASIRIVSLTADRRIAAVDVTFARPLESRRWLRFAPGEGLVDWRPPAVGESTTIPGF